MSCFGSDLKTHLRQSIDDTFENSVSSCNSTNCEDFVRSEDTTISSNNLMGFSFSSDRLRSGRLFIHFLSDTTHSRELVPILIKEYLRRLPSDATWEFLSLNLDKVSFRTGKVLSDDSKNPETSVKLINDDFQNFIANEGLTANDNLHLLSSNDGNNDDDLDNITTTTGSELVSLDDSYFFEKSYAETDPLVKLLSDIHRQIADFKTVLDSTSSRTSSSFEVTQYVSINEEDSSSFEVISTPCSSSDDNDSGKDCYLNNATNMFYGNRRVSNFFRRKWDCLKSRMASRFSFFTSENKVFYKNCRLDADDVEKKIFDSSASPTGNIGDVVNDSSNLDRNTCKEFTSWIKTPNDRRTTDVWNFATMSNFSLQSQEKIERPLSIANSDTLQDITSNVVRSVIVSGIDDEDAAELKSSLGAGEMWFQVQLLLNRFL